MRNPDRFEDLRARNAGMRQQMEAALSTVAQQVGQLDELQAAAMAVTAEASSTDGLVSVQVNATGVATDVALAPTAFERNTPAKLQRSVLQALQTAAQLAGQARAEILAPLEIELPELGELPRLQHNPVPQGPVPHTPGRPGEREIDFTGGAW